MMPQVCVSGILRSHNRKRDREQTKNNETNEKRNFHLFRYFSFIPCLSFSLIRFLDFSRISGLMFGNLKTQKFVDSRDGLRIGGDNTYSTAADNLFKLIFDKRVLLFYQR